VIEEIDSRFLGNLIPHIDFEETILAISADHSTPCQVRSHTDDPVLS